MNVKPGTAPRLAEPFHVYPAGVHAAISNYIGSRTADGDAPADIMAGLLSEDTLRKAGDREAFMDALNRIGPLYDRDGKMVRAEAYQGEIRAPGGRLRAAALRLAKAAASVFACGIDEAANAEAEQEAVGLPIRLGRADVSASEDVAAAVEVAVSTFGGLDVIVNSAGELGAPMGPSSVSQTGRPDTALARSPAASRCVVHCRQCAIA